MPLLYPATKLEIIWEYFNLSFNYSYPFPLTQLLVHVIVISYLINFNKLTGLYSTELLIDKSKRDFQNLLTTHMFDEIFNKMRMSTLNHDKKDNITG